MFDRFREKREGNLVGIAKDLYANFIATGYVAAITLPTAPFAAAASLVHGAVDELYAQPPHGGHTVVRHVIPLATTAWALKYNRALRQLPLSNPLPLAGALPGAYAFSEFGYLLGRVVARGSLEVLR